MDTTANPHPTNQTTHASKLPSPLEVHMTTKRVHLMPIALTQL